MYKFSKETNSFYPSDYFGIIPNDAVDVPDSKRVEIMNGLSLGLTLSSGIDGHPVLLEKKKQAKHEILEIHKSTLRTMRSPMLDALTGIAGRAARSGNAELASEADALAEQLLKITEDSALNSATTYEEMKSAGVLAYKRIASSASPELALIFREITSA